MAILQSAIESLAPTTHNTHSMLKGQFKEKHRQPIPTNTSISLIVVYLMKIIIKVVVQTFKMSQQASILLLNKPGEAIHSQTGVF